MSGKIRRQKTKKKFELRPLGSKIRRSENRHLKKVVVVLGCGRISVGRIEKKRRKVLTTTLGFPCFCDIRDTSFPPPFLCLIGSDFFSRSVSASECIATTGRRTFFAEFFFATLCVRQQISRRRRRFFRRIFRALRVQTE